MFARLKLGTALGLGFCLAVVAAAAISAVSLLGLNSVEKGVDDLSGLALMNTRALGAFDVARDRISRNLSGALNPKFDAQVRRSYWERLDSSSKDMHEARKAFEAIPRFPETDAAWKVMTEKLEAWERKVQPVVESMHAWENQIASGAAAEAPAAREQYDQTVKKFLEARDLSAAVDSELVKVRAAMTKEADTQVGWARAAASRTRFMVGLMSAVATLLLALIATLLTRQFGRIIASLTSAVGGLIAAVRRGELDVRADASAVHFQFRPVIEGMNETMDAYAKPIAMASTSMDRISHGDVPAPVTEVYEGDFEDIKASVNRCIGAVGALVQDAKALAVAAEQGELSRRADASRHSGDFRAIVEGVNGTIDALVRPVVEASRVLEQLAARDLRARVAGEFRGDHAKLQHAVNETAQALHAALTQVAGAVEQVSSASSQIASSSQAVASGASEQASSLEETSSSLESISTMTRQAADNAQQASGLAAAAKDAAVAGSAAMEQMSGAMERIKASAEGTSQIIKDINEIAFQTNLLALNAAVEAARAGEAGRGFAVVAEEVRSLALRSKEAASKTEELIRQSVKEAGEGEQTSRDVSGKLTEIMGSIAKVTDIVAEISASAREQSAGVNQISDAVNQMSQVTQQNAASSEESSSAASELAGQAQQLTAMVASFQLGNRQQAALAGPRRLGAALRQPSLQA